MAGYDGHRGWLYAVAVHPDLRRSGLGHRLVQFAEDALTAVICMKVNLQLLASNTATADFYKSLGYTVEPRVDMDLMTSCSFCRIFWTCKNYFALH